MKTSRGWMLIRSCRKVLCGWRTGWGGEVMHRINVQPRWKLSLYHGVDLPEPQQSWIVTTVDWELAGVSKNYWKCVLVLKHREWGGMGRSGNKSLTEHQHCHIFNLNSVLRESCALSVLCCSNQSVHCGPHHWLTEKFGIFCIKVLIKKMEAETARMENILKIVNAECWCS